MAAPVRDLPDTGRASERRPGRSPWGRRGRTTRRWSAALHRWLALVVGTVLLVELVSGTVLLFRPELYAIAHPDLFAASAPAPGATPLGPEQAIAAAQRATPDLAVGDTAFVDGVWQVSSTGYDRNVYVDPGSGRVLGEGAPTRGALGFVMNLHDCFLSCEGYTGYVATLATPVIGEVTVAGLVLGVVGLAFAVLAVSGFVAWWPATRRFAKDLRRSLTVHLRRGQYRANRDLHDVTAIIALPLLVVWAITGAGYELPFVGDAWYAVTASEPRPEVGPSTDPVPPGVPDIGPASAVAAAQRLVPGQELVSVTPPSDALGPTYVVGLQSGVAPARYAGLRTFSESTVSVDPHTARATLTAGGDDQSVADWLWTSGNYGVHFGYIVPWWGRLVWLAAGLVSVYLVGSGFWTWWWRRRRLRAQVRTTRSGGSVRRTPRAGAPPAGR